MSEPKQIKTLQELGAAALDRRAVVVPSLARFAKPKAAAWIISMPAREVLALIREGLFIYTPKNKQL